jgi:uncharacterized BrkB/YihY/UPF0761 family membrane protein
MNTNFVGYKLFSLSAREFVRDDCFTLSLSISFVFLLSIIPFATLSVLIFKSIQNAFFSQTYWAGKLTEVMTDGLVHAIPFVSRDWVATHVINRHADGSFKAINFLMLPIISGLIFKTLDTSYRRIFQLPSRHLLLGQAVYMTMSIFAILLFFVLNFIWIIVSAALPHLLSMIDTESYLVHIVETAKLCVTYQPVNLLSACIILLFYLVTIKLFLNIKIKWRYRLISGVVFCLLWLVARKFFGVYIQHIEVMFVLHSGNLRYRLW